MAQYLPLPNGQYFEIREGETPEQALAAAVEKYPSAFGLGEQKPKEDTKGFKAAAAAGFERLKGETALTAGKLGLMGLAEAEQYQKEKEAAAKARFTPTEEGWTESPWQKFKETAGGSLPYMAAPAAAGLAALAAPAALPAAALGAGAAGLVSAGQFTGTNLARQMETGKTLEQTSLGSAVGAAIPQAALDTAAMALLPGVGKLFGSVGAKLTTEEAKAIASQTLGKAAMDYTAKTGMAMGREGLTETVQQSLERLQAGLSITDPEARKEYIDSFIGGAALAGVGAPVGRYMERSAAKGQAAQAEKDEQAKAAAEAEAAKNEPDALRQLNDTYGLAKQQLAALNQKVNAAKPKKGATEEQKAAYDELKAQRADFVSGTFKPLKQEYDQRKDAIEQLLAAEQSAIEVAGAEGQQAAKLPLPSDIPGAQPFQLSDTSRLMNEYDNLRNQVGTVEQQLAAGPDLDTQTQLTQQRSQIMARMAEMAPIIEERGGVTDTEQDFAKKLAAAEKERLRLLEIGDFDAAAKQAEVVRGLQARAPYLQELNDFRTKSGQNRDLFAEAPATPTTAVDEQLKQQTLEEERSRGLYGPASKIESAKQAFGEAGIGPRGQLELAPAAAEPKAQTAIKPKQLAELEATQEKVTAAQTALNEAVKTKDTAAIYAATDALNQAKSAVALAQDEVGRGMFRPVVLDLFSPSNIINTAIQNGDSQTINNIATHTDSTALNAALDEKASERDKLVNVLENRAGVGGTDKAARVSFAPMEEGKETEGSIRTVEKGEGEQLRSVKRERANLFEKQYDEKQQALFKNGTYPDKTLQALYDKGGPAAVEYENVMQAVEALSKQVTTKQGNAKKSLYEQLVDLAAQHEALVKQLESGVATPTQREKVAGLQAKLGKGEAPAPRQMDASERHNLQRKITSVVNQYKLVEGKIAPVRDQILRLHDSLYTTTAPLEKVSVVAEKKESEARIAASKQATAVKAGEARTPKSRGAATAARINAGDVRKEAETSQKMRDLALLLGAEEEEYKKFNKNLTDRYAKLKEKYGKNDPAVANFQRDMAEQLNEKAMSLGKKTPEYKATLKEQIAYFQDTLANVSAVVGEQKAPSKRAAQVTRKQSGAPSRLVSSSPESKAESEAEGLRLKRRMMRDFEEALNSENTGIAYRLREGAAAATVNAAEAQKVVDSLKLPENVKFVYAPTTKQIPVKLLKQMAADGVDVAEGMVKGAVFPDGTVLVVGDQHADVNDLEETIAHEIIGHYGVDTVIGMERLNDFAKKTDVIKLAEELGGKELVSEVLQTVRANADLGRSEEIQKLQALREIIAHTEEARVTEAFREKAGRWLKELVGMVRAGLRDMGLMRAGALSSSDVFYMLQQSRKAFQNKTIGPYRAADGGVAFRRRSEPSEYGVGRPAGAMSNLLGNMMGLAGRVQFVDQYAALEAATKKGLSAGQISSLEATNANYLLRFGQQRSQFAGQFLTNGPVKVELNRKDGGTETLYRSTKGVSMVDVAKKLNEAKIGNDTEQEDMFTLYVAGERANQIGWDKLNYSDPADAKAKYDKMVARVNSNEAAKTAFKDAAKLYQQYNAGLLDFLVGAGALTDKKAAELKAISYVPFYRINGNGEVQLMIDKERPVRIANIKDQPQLKELVGGNTEIMPIFTSAAQNTFMITGMGLRNQAVKETSFMLQKLGIASRVASGNGPTGNNVVRFFKKGEPYYALIDTDAYGVSAELIVRGMEGIKTTLPAVIKLLGVPANILRSFVVRNPTYALRQIIRDPLNAWLTTGTDATPILSSMKELASMVAGRSDAERKLMETGAISSNVYSGDEQDMAKFLKDMAAGKSGWGKAVGKLDAFALQGDAATRAVIYKDSLAKGMTEQEALLRTLESMNFSRRGVSPSMQALSTLVPFFNAQVQGLDVIYRAFKGDMPYSQQLEIRAKMVRRGLMLAAGTIAYAAMMEDDEAYKRAKPEERFANWFVYVPGVDEPVRVPIPFEMGFLFKALPEAVWNMAMQDDKADAAVKGLGKLAMQTVPLSLPQAIKPLTEAVLGKSFYSGDIESTREKDVLATERYRDSTTELAKMLGAVTGKAGVSPITLDYLLRGYTGGLGVALVQLANPILAPGDKAEVAQPTTKIGKQPFIGGLFQPVEGRGTLDEAYDRMTEIKQIKGAYNDMVERGQKAEAKAFAQDYADKLAAMSMSGSVQKRLGELAKVERQIKASPNLTAEQKDAKLEQLDKTKVAIARQFLAVTDRTTTR